MLRLLRFPLALSRLWTAPTVAGLLQPARSVASLEPKPYQKLLTGYMSLAPNTIWDNPGSHRVRKRVGRGPGSGKGYRCG